MEQRASLHFRASAELKPAKGGGSTELSKPKLRRRSHDGTSGLRDSPIWQSLGAPNRYLWLRPTNMSWKFCNLIDMTIRDEPHEKIRSKTFEKFEAKEDELEEANRKKTRKFGDEWNDAA